MLVELVILANSYTHYTSLQSTYLRKRTITSKTTQVVVIQRFLKFGISIKNYNYICLVHDFNSHK